MQKKNIIQVFLSMAAKEVGEDIFFKGYQSILELILKNTLQVTIGKFSIVLYLPQLISYLTKIGYSSINEIYKLNHSQSSYYTKYEINTKKNGILSANNLNIDSLTNFPIQLPKSTKLNINQIKDFDDLFMNISKKQLNSIEVYRSLNNAYIENEIFICKICSHKIQIINGKQIGHAVYCYRNPNRYFEWCDYCKTNLTTSDHKSNCLRKNKNSPT